MPDLSEAVLSFNVGSGVEPGTMPGELSSLSMRIGLVVVTLHLPHMLWEDLHTHYLGLILVFLCMENSLDM